MPPWHAGAQGERGADQRDHRRALARVAKNGRMPHGERRHVEAALDSELKRAYRTLACAETLRLGAGPDARTPRAGPLAAGALLSSALRRVFIEISHARLVPSPIIDLLLFPILLKVVSVQV